MGPVFCFEYVGYHFREAHRRSPLPADGYPRSDAGLPAAVKTIQLFADPAPSL
jgi:hypothetical protein